MKKAEAKAALAKAAKKKDSNSATPASANNATGNKEARTFTPAQDAAIIEGRNRQKSNAAIAKELGDGISKKDVGARYDALIQAQDAAGGGFLKKGEGEWNGGNGGDRRSYMPPSMPLVPDKTFDERDVSLPTTN